MMSGSLAQRYARIAGVLLLLSLVGGGFGEFFVPTALIVPADAGATAHNILNSQGTFRLGFAGYLLEAICDISLTFVFYVLLKPVNANIAFLAVLFRIVATATFAVCELFYFAALSILGGAAYLKSFTPAQLDTLALLSLKFYEFSGQLLIVFYGIACVLLGYLVFKSGYIPKFLGVLFALAGIGFVAKSFALVLAPALAFPWLIAATPFALLLLMGWFFVKGVDIPKWEERQRA
jgi:hypothetical protein